MSDFDGMTDEQILAEVTRRCEDWADRVYDLTEWGAEGRVWRVNPSTGDPLGLPCLKLCVGGDDSGFTAYTITARLSLTDWEPAPEEESVPVHGDLPGLSDAGTATLAHCDALDILADLMIDRARKTADQRALDRLLAAKDKITQARQEAR